MDTNKMRTDLPSLVRQSIEAHPGYAAFAAWCKDELIHPRTMYFLIWQASRYNLVVELPDHREVIYGRPDNGQLSGMNHGIDLCREAIQGQGLKVKQ